MSRLTLLLVLVASLSTVGAGQSTSETPAHSGGSQITGTVTVDGKPAAGIVIVLYAPADKSSERNSGFAISEDMGDLKGRAVSDASGTYAFQDLPAADYIVFPVAPTFSAPFSQDFVSPGKPVSVGDGESIDGIDFSLGHGGVITGRVTRPNGQPVIEAIVQVIRLDVDYTPALDMATGTNEKLDSTDDRGIYRIYGLEPGKYLVRSQVLDTSASGQIYYPGVADKAKAVSVTISAGQEIGGIDISLGNASSTYEADGQAMDDNGQPVSGAMYCHSPSLDGRHASGYSQNPSEITDSNGRFRITGLAPGKYVVFFTPSPGQPMYSDPSYFTISDANVSGIHLSVHTGATVSGVVMVGGNTDAQASSQLSAVVLKGYPPYSSQLIPYYLTVHPAPDGTFQLSGLPPGPMELALDPSQTPQGFSLLQVTQNGVPQPSRTIAVGAGDQITGLQVQLIYGTGSVRGQAIFQGGQLPAGTQVFAFAQLVSGDQATTIQVTAVDARGTFQLNNLPDGQYQLIVKWFGDLAEGSQQGPIVTVSGGQAPQQCVIVNLGQPTPSPPQ